MKGGMTMIPASILTAVAAVVCKKVMDTVFDDEPSKTINDVIKDHDNISKDIILEMIRREIEEQREGEEE